jgi:sulfur relay (sulfurtransferase) DsrC/TusE family protein
MQNKCIGECIKPGDKTLNPITLEIIRNDKNKKICASEPYLGSIQEIEEEVICNSTNEKEFNQIQDMILSPEITFNLKSFLGLYNITSFNAGLLWLRINIDNKSYFNINRIINSIWIAFNYQVKKIDNDLINIYHDILKNLLDKEYYQKINTSPIKKKIIKKALKRFIKNTNKWDSFNFNPNNEITLLLIKYFKKYN